MKRRKAKKRIIAVFAVLVSVSLVFLCLFEWRARPIIKKVAASQAENKVNNIIEDAIVRVIEENNITYSSLVDVEKDSAGRVSTVQADTISMNVLKSKISREVSKDILELDSKEIKIPVGTIIGASFLSGKGPRIKTDVTLASNINTVITNKFSSAGINQTLHEIIVIITATVYVIMPHSRTTAEVNVNFCVAQTVIIGAVPETFAEFEKTGEKND